MYLDSELAVKLVVLILSIKCSIKLVVSHRKQQLFPVWCTQPPSSGSNPSASDYFHLSHSLLLSPSISFYPHFLPSPFTIISFSLPPSCCFPPLSHHLSVSPFSPTISLSPHSLPPSLCLPLFPYLTPSPLAPLLPLTIRLCVSLHKWRNISFRWPISRSARDILLTWSVNALHAMVQSDTYFKVRQSCVSCQSTAGALKCL